MTDRRSLFGGQPIDGHRHGVAGVIHEQFVATRATTRISSTSDACFTDRLTISNPNPLVTARHVAIT